MITTQRRMSLEHQKMMNGTNPNQSQCVGSNSDVSIGLCIVRVKISLKSDRHSYVETFALLDTGSQGTFIVEDMLRKVNVTGLDTTISVKTIHGERTDKFKAIEQTNARQ